MRKFWHQSGSGPGPSSNRRKRGYVFGAGHRMPLNRRVKGIVRKWAERHLSRGLRRILTELLSSFHNSLTGRCDPSQTTIGKLAGYSRETVNRFLKELRELGVIDWDNRLRWEMTDAAEQEDLFGGVHGTVRVARQTTNQYFLGPTLLQFLSKITLTRKEEDTPYVDSSSKAVDKSLPPMSEALRLALRGLAASAGWLVEGSG